MTIRLTYRGGVFVPERPLHQVQEGTVVSLELPQGASDVLPPGHALAGIVGGLSDETAEGIIQV